jgi:hypothetical protein
VRGRQPGEQRPDGESGYGGDLPEVAGEEVGQHVVGDDAYDARLAGGGADGQAAAERDADQGYPVQVEVVEYRGQR